MNNNGTEYFGEFRTNSGVPDKMNINGSFTNTSLIISWETPNNNGAEIIRYFKYI